MRTRQTLGLAGMAVVLAGLLNGCGKDSDRPEYREVSGRIVAIDRESEEVSMSYFNKKRGETRTLKGRLAPEAEILIDGATARLEDLRVDDRVRVTGRVEDHNGEPRVVATRVRVMRQEQPEDEDETTTRPEESEEES